MRVLYLILAILAILAMAVSSFAQTSQPISAPSRDNLTPQQEQILDRIKLEAEAATMSRRQVTSIEDVIQFRRHGGQLAATLKAAPVDQETRLIVPGVAGLLKLRTFTLNAGAGETETGYTLTLNDLTGQAPFQSITMVSLMAGKLSLSRDRQEGDTTTNVQLLQGPPQQTPDPDAPACVLYISRTDSSGRTQDVSFKRTANTFDDLCIKFSDDVNQFLRPILRDFKQESAVFAPNTQLAWQVLGGDYIVEPSVLERVNRLVTKLDADSYEDRQAALEGLREIGEPAALILMRADRSVMSPEKQSSVDEFLTPFVQLTADEAKAMRDDPTFLLDILTSDDVELRKLAWERLKSISHTDVNFDPRGEDAERAAAIDKLRATIKK
jgi:hypothetical protein